MYVLLNIWHCLACENIVSVSAVVGGDLYSELRPGPLLLLRLVPRLLREVDPLHHPLQGHHIWVLTHTKTNLLVSFLSLT
jgi:hypothetical protein